jgi:DNA-binding response OmpR family regulator
MYYLPPESLSTPAQDAVKTITRARVMVVDDDRHLLSLLGEALETVGYEVILARDGVEALRLFHARRPDVLITDLLMPKRSGIELVLAILQGHPDARIIAMSGLQGGFLEGGIGVGVKHVFTKPFEISKLLAAVGDLVD